MPLPGYSIVVATRNRLDALRLSLPRMLAQDPAPAQLIIVDSSDDHASVAALAREATDGHPVRLEVIAAERGLTRQRNLGLRAVDQPIVFFPDDDSILYPGMAAAVLAVYARDIAMQVSAVCAYEARTPPTDFSIRVAPYAMSRSYQFKRPWQRLRGQLEDRFFPDPSRILGRKLIADASIPTWLNELSANPVEWMTGFRMTFRTQVIAEAQFDETLTRYCLFEDHDASFSAWQRGAVVATSAAKVFHYRSPEKRDAGYRLGVEHLLNQAYVIAKHTAIGHPARRSALRHAKYKNMLYRLAARDEFGNQRFAGSQVALSEVKILLDKPSSETSRAYGEALQRSLHSSQFP